MQKGFQLNCITITSQNRPDLVFSTIQSECILLLLHFLLYTNTLYSICDLFMFTLYFLNYWSGLCTFDKIFYFHLHSLLVYMYFFPFLLCHKTRHLTFFSFSKTGKLVTHFQGFPGGIRILIRRLQRFFFFSWHPLTVAA